jgi:hypothetical protein
MRKLELADPLKFQSSDTGMRVDISSNKSPSRLDGLPFWELVYSSASSPVLLERLGTENVRRGAVIVCHAACDGLGVRCRDNGLGL